MQPLHVQCTHAVPVLRYVPVTQVTYTIAYSIDSYIRTAGQTTTSLLRQICNNWYSTTMNMNRQQAEFDDFFVEDDDPVISNPSSSIGRLRPAAVVVPSNPQPTTNASYGATSANAPLSWWKRVFFIFAIETYQPYFNVDSIDIQHRIVSSLKYFNVTNGFWETVLTRTLEREGRSDANDLPYPGQPQGNVRVAGKATQGPDAYGPFWLATTLIFIVAVSSL